MSFLRLVAVLGLTLLSRVHAANAPRAAPDGDGFVPIFDGRSLFNWDGNPTYWQIEDGAIVGEVTPATLLEQNSFLIWRGGTPADFELKLEYRISRGGNSGINYRSTELAGLPFALRGYQCDLDGPERNPPPRRHTGQNYEERGRTFLAYRGQVVRIDDAAKPAAIASVGDAQELAATLKPDDWNEVHLIARGPMLTHIINGRVMSIVYDDDRQNRRTEGLLGMQVHVGPPMKVEFRHIRLKDLSRP